MPSSSSSSSSSVSSSSSKSSKSSSAMSYNTRNARAGIPPRSPLGERGSSEDEDSSDPSSFSDDEREKRNKKMTKKPETSKGSRPSKAQKRKKSESSEDEAYEEFKHLFDTKAEYIECMNKTEKEKEQIIYEKMEKYEQMKDRKRIEATLAARARGEELANSSYAGMDSGTKKKERGRPPKKQAPRKPASDDSDSEMDAEFHQPTDIARKKQQKTAMANLAQKRKEKERKEEKKKASLSVDAVFGKDESDSSSSDDSSSTTSSSSSSSSSLSDEAPAVEESRPVESLEELKKAQISRKLLRVLVFTPQFADVVTGGYVLIRSVEMENSHNEFHIWKIVDVIEGVKPYRLDDVKTTKFLRCRWANQEKTMQLTYVSNQYFTQDQYDEFRLVNNQDLPTIEFLNQKELIIQKNRTPQYTKEVVDHIVREKKKFGLSHTNFALAKSELIGKRTAYENNNQRELATEVQKEIDALDKKASELEKKRLGDIAHVNMINQRNRQQQSNKFFGQHKKLMTAVTEEENPFTRKKERMRVVCGTSKTAELSQSEGFKETTVTAATLVKEEKPEVAPDVKKEEPIVPVKVLTLAEKIRLAQSGGQKKKEPVDVFNLHNSIDFDFGFELPLVPKNAGKSSTSRKNAYY